MESLRHRVSEFLHRPVGVDNVLDPTYEVEEDERNVPDYLPRDTGEINLTPLPE